MATLEAFMRLSRVRHTCACVVGLLAVVTAAGSAAQKKPEKPIKVFAYVEQNESGFVDQKTKDLADSLKDLREAIQKKKDWLQLAEARDVADIVVHLKSRDITNSGRFEDTTSTSSTNKSGATTTTTSRGRQIMLYNVRTVMSVGQYSNEIVGSVQDTYILGGLWRTAAGNVAGQLETWVKDNYTKLMVDKALKK
jgi:hypothetical protein